MGYLFALDLGRYSSPLPKIDEQPLHRRGSYELDCSDSESDSASSSPSSSLCFDDLSPLSHSSSSSSLVSFASEAESDDARDGATSPEHAQPPFALSPTLPPSPPLCPFSLSDLLIPVPSHSTNPPPAPRLPARTMLFPCPPSTSSPPPPYPHHETRREFGLGLALDRGPELVGARRDDSPMEGVELDGDGDDQDGDNGEGLGLELYETRFRSIFSHDWFEGQGGDWEGPREHKRRRTLVSC